MSEEEKEGLRDVTSDSSGLLGVHLSSGRDTEDEVSDQELPLPPDLDWLDELSEEDDDDGDGDGDFKVVADYGKKRSYAETARMFKLRRNLHQLDSFHQQKEHDVLKARQTLNLCRQNIKSLLEQRENLEDAIEQQKAADNSVAVFRLRAQHKNLCGKLQSEEELEGHVNTELKQLELELSRVELELGRLSSLRQEVQEEERVFQVLKAQKAATRLQQAREAGQTLQFKMQHLRDKQAAMMRKEEQESQKKFEESQANRKTAAKFLKQSRRRIHQQEAEKEQQNQQLLEKRIQAVESLKCNIAATQETLRVQQIKVKANALKKEEQQRQLKESLQHQDMNSIRHMYQQKKQEEMKQKQLEFKERQQSKKVEIVAKMLQEEQQLMSSKRHQAKMPKPSTADRLPSPGKARDNLLHYLDPSPPSATEESASVQSRRSSDTGSSSSASSYDGDLEDAAQQEVDHQRLADSLAEPEFSGLWNQNYKMLRTEKKVVQAEVEVEEAALACGKPAKKGLKTAPFTSKPEVILFKDFEVGQTYKKKIVLTNVGYTTNHCKLLGMCTRLTDFVSINFESPGFLSAGMSCDLQAVFQPMINEDMDGHILFTSGAGSFSVPVRCTTKKCELEVDSQLLDFGSHVVGQTISRTITLMNKGALGTLFSLDTSARLVPETHHVQTPFPAPAPVCQETNGHSATSDSPSADAGEIRPQPAEATQHEKPSKGTEAVDRARVLTDVEAKADESYQDSGDIRLVGKTPDMPVAVLALVLHVPCGPCEALEVVQGSLGLSGGGLMVQDGEIGPFQSIKLELVFTPTVPGDAKLDFLIKFSHPSSKPILVHVRGIAVSIPVWVTQPNIDLKICMFDCLYQDTITVQSRASTALKVTFEVCPEMRKHMEIVPKTGFIQAQASFNAQLRFLPRLSLSKDVKTCFDSDTGVLEAAAEVQVAGQVQSVHLTVHAVVTSSDLKFDHTELDFGYCSIFQSVKSSVCLTNMSLLPQDFGFLDVPEFIEVQPNDGFGTLLPQETLHFDLIFSPSKVDDYNFQLHCKSGINRDFLLSCQAVGVRPPLELSHSLVKFGATALGDHSAAVLYLINPHTGRNQSKPGVTTTVAKDALTPSVTPRLFCFVLPNNCLHVNIAPSTGRLLPGEKCLVQVTFSPVLLEQEIKQEVIRLHQQARLLREKELNMIKEQEAKENIKKKKSSAKRKNSKMSDEFATFEHIQSPKPKDMQPGSEQYERARASLLYSFAPCYNEYIVPCFISDGDPPEEDRQAQPTWSPFNALYLKLQCPAVRPALMVTSNNGETMVDFKQVSVGETVIQKFTVQNISDESLELRTSVLDTQGPFSLLNALRVINPGGERTLVLAFSPADEKKHCEILEINTTKMSLELTLCGEGVYPTVTSSHPGGLLDFGYVFAKEKTSQVVQLRNSSVVEVGFRTLLASLSVSRPQDGVDTVDILLGNYTDSQVQPTIGTQNYNGLSVFTVVPGEGSIAPGQSQAVTITFQPDHPSVNYSDKLTIELMNKSQVCVMDLKGAASSHHMYVQGGDVLTVPIESLLPPLPAAPVEKGIPVLLTLCARSSGGAVIPAVRELQVGSVCSTQHSKKSGEFSWDDVGSLQEQGFSVVPSKGTVEPGHKCTITVTWTPQSGYKPYDVVRKCVSLYLKGDERYIYKVTLMALVSYSAE